MKKFKNKKTLPTKPINEPLNARIVLRIYDSGVDIVKEETNLANGETELNSIGWVNLRDAKLTPEITKALTSDEAKLTEHRLKVLQDRLYEKERADAYLLHGEINRIRTWIETASLRDVNVISDDLMFEINELRKLLLHRLS